MRYVERKTLRAGLVERAEDWPWGSLHQRAPQASGPLLGQWPLQQSADWTERGDSPQSEAALDAIRRWLRRGIPHGDPACTDQTAKQLHLQSTLIRRCRRRKRFV